MIERQFRISISRLSRFVFSSSEFLVLVVEYRRSLAATGVYGLLRNDFLKSTWRINADVKSRARTKTTRLFTKARPSSFQYIATFFSTYLSTNRPRGPWHVEEIAEISSPRLA